MKKREILQLAIEELQSLAVSCGKSLTPKTLNNLFIHKKAYQSDWPHIVLRRKALMIAGITSLLLETELGIEDITAQLALHDLSQAG